MRPFCIWTSRASESDDLEKLVLRFCIGLRTEPLGSWHIRARSISFTTRPRRPEGPRDHERAGETFFSISLSNSQTSAGNPLLLLGLARAVSHPWRT